MIRNPIDISTRVSPRLSALIKSRVEDPDNEQPITLEDIRRFFVDFLPADFQEAERLHHFDIAPSLLDELDALIEQFGLSALALDFIQSSASEQMSRVIDALVNDDTREGSPTLTDVKTAILNGLGARLVGEGALEEDEDDTLLEEIDMLIEYFGADAMAEELMRYE